MSEKERGKGFVFPFKEIDAKEIRNRSETIDRKMHGLINSLRRRL